MKQKYLTFALAAGLLLAMPSVTSGAAQAAASQVTQTYTLPPLPYAYDALDAVIDEETMKIHHGKHHQGYVNNLNAALADYRTPKTPMTLEQLLSEISKWPAAVRNNAGGHWNHSFFWTSLTPMDQFKAPQGAFKTALERQYGSLEAFQDAFEKAGASQFGSGWVWLIQKADGSLAITSTSNQDNPLMDVASVQGQPLLGWDVWEHAYYLKYQNRRADYLKSMWKIVNWEQVASRYRPLQSAK